MTRLRPRRPSDVNKRGQILLLFGFIWCAIGVSTYLNPTLPGQEHLLFQPVPMWAHAGGWVVTGMVSMLYALRPAWLGRDGLGFLSLYIMPAVSAVVFLWGWIDWLLPVGGPGYGAGMLFFAMFLALVVAVMVIADWPDPPVNPPPIAPEDVP